MDIIIHVFLRYRGYIPSIDELKKQGIKLRVCDKYIKPDNCVLFGHTDDECTFVNERLFDNNALSHAAQYGNLNIMHWLLDNNIHIDAEAIRLAAQHPE